MHEVGRLPGDAPAPFREAIGRAQWKCVVSRKLIQLLSGMKLTDITNSRTEQAELELLAKDHILDTDGVLCKVGVPGVPRPLPVIPDVKVGAELPSELRGEPHRAHKNWREMFLDHAHRATPRGHANVSEMELELLPLVYWDYP